MDLYAQNIMDHYRNPRNLGKIENAFATHREANYSCGDVIEIWLNEKKDSITDVKYQGEGCAVSQAAMSILSEHILKKSVDEVLKMDFGDIIKLLGVPVSQRRKKCSLLGLLAVQNAILKHNKKPLKKWSEVLGD